MTREDVLREFWCAEALADEVVRLRAKLQTARDGIAKIIMHTGRLPNASPDFLAALGGDDA